MFDLEPSITEWRRQMLAAGLKTGRRLDELESHLRAEISALKSAGASEAVAFEQAVTRLGSPHSMYTEFNKNWGWDPKEIGGLCASAWLVALVVMQRYGRLRDRAMMLLGIGGSTVVSLAWFGGYLWDNHRRLHGYGSETGWLLAVLLGIHLLFLVMGMTPARESRES